MCCASFLGVNTADHLGTVSDSSLSVEGTVLTSHTLANNFGVLVDENFGLLSSLIATSGESSHS